MYIIVDMIDMIDMIDSTRECYTKYSEGDTRPGSDQFIIIL